MTPGIPLEVKSLYSQLCAGLAERGLNTAVAVAEVSLCCRMLKRLSDRTKEIAERGDSDAADRFNATGRREIHAKLKSLFGDRLPELDAGAGFALQVGIVADVHVPTLTPNECEELQIASVKRQLAERKQRKPKSN